MAKQQHIEMVPPTGAKQLHSTPELLIASKTPIMTNWVGIGALCSRPSRPIISVPRFWPRKIKSVSMAIPVKRYCKQQSKDKNVSNIFRIYSSLVRCLVSLVFSPRCLVSLVFVATSVCWLRSSYGLSSRSCSSNVLPPACYADLSLCLTEVVWRLVLYGVMINDMVRYGMASYCMGLCDMVTMIW